jgi:hypothetical protein
VARRLTPGPDERSTFLFRIMNKTTTFLALVAALGFSIDAAAQQQPQWIDHDKVRCEAVAKDEMRPQMELQRKLSGEGWKVRQVKNFNGCYEVYGFDDKGQRTEAFFHPKSFDMIGRVKQGD